MIYFVFFFFLSFLEEILYFRQTNFKDNAKYQEKAMFPNRTNLQTSRSRDNIPTSSSYIPEILSTNRSSVLNKPKEIVPFYTITKVG